MSEPNNIIMIQMNLTNIIKTCYNEVEGIRNKYGSSGSIPPLPEYKKLKSSFEFYYNYYSQMIQIGDDITNASLSLSIVAQGVHDIKVNKINRDLTNNYILLQDFKKFVEESSETLAQYRTVLAELKRQVVDRIRLLQAMNYHS